MCKISDPAQSRWDEASAHHVARVLRLGVGSEVELFDETGAVASATIAQVDGGVVVTVAEIRAPEGNVREITVACAVPKGERADWMVEKLSELGCARWIPLATTRSVVLPEGRNKRERWMRLATESAKQSRRAGVMRVDELTRLGDAVGQADRSGALFLSTDPGAASIVQILSDVPGANVTLFIGPEGGWSDEEIELFARSNIRGVKLTDTVLRVETAAIAAAAVAATWVASNLDSSI